MDWFIILFVPILYPIVRIRTSVNYYRKQKVDKKEENKTTHYVTNTQNESFFRECKEKFTKDHLDRQSYYRQKQSKTDSLIILFSSTTQDKYEEEEIKYRHCDRRKLGVPCNQTYPTVLSYGSVPTKFVVFIKKDHRHSSHEGDNRKPKR